ncbi:MAG TPA: gamma-glutamyl-gamma-aminobutyrate hydrolase family protein [Steroidobacteraceae bacterium]|nr:gamma-glutamyl-gamma-aminobutyrate hydrolase family protein [Steroidobacteraceae bacterium]
MSPQRPVIGIPADRRMIGPHPFQAVGEKYIDTVVKAAGALPFLIPVLEPALDLDEVLQRVDGLLFIGSPSNVEPHRYNGRASDAGTLHDPHRDQTTLALIPHAVERGVPVLGICRGFQEMNVAFGGTLHQKVQELPGHLDHREDKTQPLDVQYAPAHELLLESASVLRSMTSDGRPKVNSLHSQGVDRLGAGLSVDARAPDGIVEAFHVDGAPHFAMAVQWHPEWQVMSNSFSRALFAAFGAAARSHLQSR